MDKTTRLPGSRESTIQAPFGDPRAGCSLRLTEGPQHRRVPKANLLRMPAATVACEPCRATAAVPQRSRFRHGASCGWRRRLPRHHRVEQRAPRVVPAIVGTDELAREARGGRCRRTWWLCLRRAYPCLRRYGGGPPRVTCSGEVNVATAAGWRGPRSCAAVPHRGRRRCRHPRGERLAVDRGPPPAVPALANVAPLPRRCSGDSASTIAVPSGTGEPSSQTTAPRPSGRRSATSVMTIPA
jgi:hypothetical protein